MTVERLRSLYLDLMRDCLTGMIYDDPPLEWKGEGTRPFDRRAREMGMDWPAKAHSMIGKKRMLQLQQAAESILERRIPGDFIETGVWRGGACILLRAVLKAYGVTDRRVWVADSFAGLPQPDPERYPADRGDTLYSYPALAVPIERVRENFAPYALLMNRSFSSRAGLARPYRQPRSKDLPSCVSTVTSTNRPSSRCWRSTTKYPWAGSSSSTTTMCFPIVAPRLPTSDNHAEYATRCMTSTARPYSGNAARIDRPHKSDFQALPD